MARRRRPLVVESELGGHLRRASAGSPFPVRVCLSAALLIHGMDVQFVLVISVGLDEHLDRIASALYCGLLIALLSPRRCPRAYHTGDLCTPAGSVEVSLSHIVCPAHYARQLPSNSAHYKTQSTSWCFACKKGGYDRVRYIASSTIGSLTAC